MTAAQRREQLISVGRTIFAERGFQATTMEDIAARAGVSKPVVYEHFGGKEGLYDVVVDREMNALLDSISQTLTGGHPRQMLAQAGMALLNHIESQADGFRILVRDSPPGSASGNYAGLIGDVANQAEYILAAEFRKRGLDPTLAPMYSQMLVGMVSLTGQWWLDVRTPDKSEVVAHLVNLAWNGLSNLESDPETPA